MRALVTGATGFIGPRLLELLDRPVVLSRNADRARQELSKYEVEAYSWDPMEGPPPAKAFEGVDTVFHLAGESVAAGRWTARQKRRIRESREVGTRNLVDALRKLDKRPKVFVSASAVGYYGSRGNDVLDETNPPGNDFLSYVCVAWEREAQKAADLGMREVCLRTGIVLGPDGGALKKMITPFKLGLGGPLGNGSQWMSWIHVEDLAALYIHCANKSTLSGPVNGVSPNPVTNREFTKTLAGVLNKPAMLPAPYFALRVALGEFAKVLFDSQRAVPKAAQASEFDFRYPDLAPALEAILCRQEKPEGAVTV
jgi:hypothetical protein